MAAEPVQTATADARLNHVGITFEATGVKLYFGVGESMYGSNGPRLIYSLKLPIGERLHLSSGEDTREMPITLALTREASSSPQAIGALYYMERYDDDVHPHAAHLLAEIALPDQNFDDLLALARLGRFPSKLNMDVQGLTYGWAPDGSDAEWNVADKSKHKVIVTHIDFSLPLGGAAIDEAAEESGKTIEQPLSRDMFENLHAHLSSIASSTRWILFGLVVVVVIVAIRAYR